MQLIKYARIMHKLAYRVIIKRSRTSAIENRSHVSAHVKTPWPKAGGASTL